MDENQDIEPIGEDASVAEEYLDSLLNLHDVDTSQWGIPLEDEVVVEEIEVEKEPETIKEPTPSEESADSTGNNNVNGNEDKEVDPESANIFNRIIGWVWLIGAVIIFIVVGNLFINHWMKDRVENIKASDSVPADLSQLAVVPREDRLGISEIKEIISSAKEVSPISYEISLQVKLRLEKQLVWEDVTEDTKMCLMENGDKLYMRGIEIIYLIKDSTREK